MRARTVVTTLQALPRWQRIALVGTVAVVHDAADYVGLALPVIGDVADVATTLVLAPVVGAATAAPGLVELLPGVDFLPTYTVIVAWWLWRTHDVPI